MESTAGYMGGAGEEALGKAFEQVPGEGRGFGHKPREDPRGESRFVYAILLFVLLSLHVEMKLKRSIHILLLVDRHDISLLLFRGKHAHLATSRLSR